MIKGYFSGGTKIFNFFSYSTKILDFSLKRVLPLPETLKLKYGRRKANVASKIIIFLYFFSWCSNEPNNNKAPRYGLGEACLQLHGSCLNDCYCDQAANGYICEKSRRYFFCSCIKNIIY
jgi:hypothetical protein